MFYKLSIIFASVLVTLTVAMPNGTPDTQATPASLSLVGLDLSGLNVAVGLTCSPTTDGGENCGIDL
ncbi:hypothetical protein MVEN_01156400 [Mycena venus]|uniref:Hydrophobin n=1 Tax=Mycena venus TaxID=2733690 RepID=A0A8H6Y3V3_9AGAR|nr:hypothetical protein MVEN_01156400 [Mycena venus]